MSIIGIIIDMLQDILQSYGSAFTDLGNLPASCSGNIGYVRGKD
jgi:hypothetical protein